MPRCFVFGIGGTGSRVIESVTHLLASGAGLDKLASWEFVPIIIDMDNNNGNLGRTHDLLLNYRSLHRPLEKEGEHQFFRYKVSPLGSIIGLASSGAVGQDDFRIPLYESRNPASLAEAVGYNTLPAPEQSLARLLYDSDENPAKSHLHMDLNVGFKGAPHIGATVLNQFTYIRMIFGPMYLGT